jgi:uncharacterized glyoxalase superfamily protein PhnB
LKLKNVRPILETDDVNGTREFYTKVLGFECDGHFEEDGKPTWISLVKDNVVIMFGARNAHSGIPTPTMTGSLYFEPDNVDEAWAELKDKVTVEYPIENFDYGMREFAIRDCNGYVLQFGREISES